ncbi:hypothetical protein ACET3Z_029419 [Daucus carota]
MSTMVALGPLVHHQIPSLPTLFTKTPLTSSLNYPHRAPLSVPTTSVSFKSSSYRPVVTARATETDATTRTQTDQSADVVFTDTFPVRRAQKVEGKLIIKLDKGNSEGKWELMVGCTLPGKWILHWGVNYVDDTGSEWDQPPIEMRPPDSIPVKDYAIETPLKISSKEKEVENLQTVKIGFDSKSLIAAINFVLKDEETGAWYQHKGRDFKISVIDCLPGNRETIGSKKGSKKWPGALGQLSSMILQSEGVDSDGVKSSNDPKGTSPRSSLKSFCEEHPIVKETLFDNAVKVSVSTCPETAKKLLYMETDLPGDIVVHWGVCKDESKKWEIPAEPHPVKTTNFKNKALRTILQRKGEEGAGGLFTMEQGLVGFLFVLKLNDDTWLNCMGNDFYVPLSTSSDLEKLSVKNQSEDSIQKVLTETVESDSSPISKKDGLSDPTISEYTDEIINEIRSLVTGISSEKKRKTKSKETQETILQEIEKLAAEAYSIFRSPIPAFTESDVIEKIEPEAPVKICSGTGSGFEILCQGFNWESNKSGRWYMELQEKAAELASLGFTVVWLPPPTESISPEGYMPKDLYNLNSRYGTVDELKILIEKFHEFDIKVLGDAVLNHRCAHHQNQNGVWNIFGGRLNWDDRAVVADDPHFQGRGNKSSGDNFHAAPNIDHSQDFVRKDLKEWLCWLRKDIGYDGWRLDYVRGFWGGYVKDYMEVTEPYFAVGEYWDSLSYSYGEMDHNQDAHRQRIIDWINATSGTAGAFDVTTKGILHAALERCEYWRLSDEKGKPPGVVGWWPSRAVTFIENHDTGSTQGHWRFPGGREMQGYAYILTHPGTPSVFYDHIFSHLNSEISALISIRTRNKINCRSTVNITKAERDVYAAIIDEKVAVKIGPGHYEPQHQHGNQNWSLAREGRDYKVWEAS